jgi:hypothetical protein
MTRGLPSVAQPDRSTDLELACRGADGARAPNPVAGALLMGVGVLRGTPGLYGALRSEFTRVRHAGFFLARVDVLVAGLRRGGVQAMAPMDVVYAAACRSAKHRAVGRDVLDRVLYPSTRSTALLRAVGAHQIAGAFMWVAGSVVSSCRPLCSPFGVCRRV